jgi:predicted transcriptional regulator
MSNSSKKSLISRDFELMHVLRERGINITRLGALTISQQTIAEWLGCSRKTIQRSFARLAAAGYIGKIANWRRVLGRNYRASNSYYLLKEKAYNLMAWINRISARKTRVPLSKAPVWDTAVPAKRDIYKKNRWTTEDLRGLGRDEAYIAAISAMAPS